jgi:hypothetical protein
VVAALLATSEAVTLDPFMEMLVPKLEPTRPFMYHENEDYNSVPDPMTNKRYMTSTQAKLLSKNQDDHAWEPSGLDPQFFVPYNRFAPEPVEKGYGDAEGGLKWTAYVQTGEDSDSSDSDSSDSDSDGPEDENNLQISWMVDADYGEKDEVMVPREVYADDVGQSKASGWTNPLAWTDSGDDDDAILAQQKSRIRLIPAEDITLVQITDDDEDDEDEDVETEEAAITAESIVTEKQVQVDRGFGDEDVL